MDIRGTTGLAGVIGWPVDHSRSPAMHNAAYAALGLDRAYVALPVPPARLEAALRGLTALGFAGANVTIPHKAAALAFCDTASAAAGRCGGANTVLVGDDGALHADSTDGAGILLAAAWAGVREALAAPATVLGAGGSAAAAAAALLDAGATRVEVCARRPEAAAALVADLGARTGAADRLAVGPWPPSRPAPVLVHATPVGQRDDEPPPVDARALAGADVVIDLAYRADGAPTALAAAARGAGAAVVDGLDVLAGQGALAFGLLTGREPPVEVMRAAARGAGTSS
jgi:shikimate dehydrogenase